MAGAFQPSGFQTSGFQSEAGATFTIDAVLKAERTGSVTANAVFRVGREGSFTLDAVLNDQIFRLDAVIRAEMLGSVTANAVLRVGRSGSITADAWLRLRATGSFTADAVLKRTRAFTFTANAIKRKTQTGSRNLNAVLRKTTTAQLSLDAELAYHRLGNLTASAVIHREQQGALALRACIRNNEAAVAASTGVTQVHIRVNGADITDDVIFKDASFTTLVNGQVGSFRFRVKDTDRTRSFTTGDEVTLDIDGIRRFGGYLNQPARAFFFEVEDTSDISRVARVLTFSGGDYNALFQKRVVRDKVRPANVALRSWPEDTPDDTIIKYIFDNYTDLYDDGFTTDGVEHVGFPNPDHKGVVGSGGLYFGDLMREVNRLIGAVWYFSPDKNLTFADVDQPNASKSLSDKPGGGAEIGYREFSHVANAARMANDALVWGAAQGVAAMKFGRNTNATSISAHGLWQYGEFTTQLYKQASVNLRASSVVVGTPQSKRGGKDDQVSWSVKTYDTAFVIGQKVAIESEVFGVSDVVPIRKMTITFPTKTGPLFDMILSHDIDEPWNTFEFVFPKFDLPYIRIPPIDPPDIEIDDPLIPVCWTNPPIYLDDFNRSFISPNPDETYDPSLSDVGCTSHGSYPWFGDNLSTWDEDFTNATVALNGGFDVHLAQGPGTGDSYNFVGPDAGEYIEQGATELYVNLPVDGRNYRLEFTALLTQGGDFDHDPGGPNSPDYVNSSHNQNRTHLFIDIDRKPGPYTGVGTLTDDVYIELVDNAGLYDYGGPSFGCFAFLNDSLAGNPLDSAYAKVGEQGAFASGVGVVLIREGDNLQLTVGALTQNLTIPTDESVGPGESYLQIAIYTELRNEALGWGPAFRPNAAGYAWFAAHGNNSEYRVRVSELRFTTTEGNCIDVPGRNANPDLNGVCG